MTASKLTVFLTALAFFAYGVGFVFAPDALSQWVIDTIPSSESSRIDMRATYGGLSLAVGAMLVVLSRSELRLGLVGVLIVMTCMAVARAYGIAMEASASATMYIYLVFELVIAIVAGVLLARTRNNDTIR